MKSTVVIASVLAVVVVFLAVSEAPADGAELLLPPTERPVADPYRPPDGPYGAGNRGIEYRTELGDRITAAAGGEVVFAGPVAGSLFVTVLHPSGLRTTYGFLQAMVVRLGSVVRRGALIGSAHPGFHFTVRDGDTYLDPAALFGEVRVRVRLVAGLAAGGADRASVPRAVFLGGVSRVGFRVGPVS